MKQISLAATGFQLVTKRTRKRVFLDEMRAGPGNPNSAISVGTAPEGEDLAREDWSKDEQKTPPHALSGMLSAKR